ncbi:Nuclear transport factor 2 (NTF2) domain protein [Nonomuraea coxensis DSM 45129]|uniref:Nuclear transport factor 2 (NTF2) domain protein n=1 Tax=Nonomuraea coxensis DSM 45129 TaxID=1122611 RepID=A0ABX8TTX2_9ACTN|nr:SgcJ/EcaC family oxidoreductase [Nonomuraea coxensis]QYC37738.1 Nuclear transport factor 2 (NTF2) domain protein [Nonomuraea coxensis DSM 45129]
MSTTEATNEINRLLARLTETWNAGDSAGYADLFTADADYVTFFGLHLKGREAIEETHRGLFETSIKLDESDVEPSIRYITDDVAVVVVGGASSVNGVPDPSRTSTVTFTALRTPEGWRFASFHNSRVIQS